MKSLSLFFVSALILLSSCSDKANLCGSVTGCSSDTVLIFTTDVSTGQWIDVDTVALKDGYFETQIADTALLEIQISAMRKHGTQEAQIIGSSFFFFPGDKMMIEGKLPYGLVAKGTALYDDLSKQHELTEVQNQLADIDDKSSQYDEEENEALLDSLDDEYDRLIDKENQLKFEVIKKQPNTILAGYLALSLNSKEGTEAISLLSDEVKNGLLSQLIKEAATEYQRDLSIEEAKERMVAGVVAPHFSLMGLDGNLKTSEDFKGKYLVLDFWGTWCGWCLAGIPDMKTYYAKYKNKIEFVGICTNDKEDKWRKAVEKYQLPWVNLFAKEDTEVLLDFAISCFPTKMIIDPTGKIIEVFEGESEDFYNKLDELFK